MAINQHYSERKITGINKIGLYTLIKKEILRFLTVYLQTIIAPVISTVIFFTIFMLAFGGDKRGDINGIPFLEFLAPGLIIMAMLQNAFANSSSALIIAKMQGSIVDILMPPLSSLELLIGFLSGSILRAVIIGVLATIVLSFIAPIQMHALWAVVAFAFLGAVMFASIGVATGLWAEKFDHIAAITNFIIMPMTFLSGTFYSVMVLPELWQKIAYMNPVFHIINGFRYGFTGHTDCSLYMGMAVLFLCNVALLLMNYMLLKTGYKVKS